MQNRFLSSDQRGMTLVEIMIVIGLLGGVSLVAMTMMKQQTKGQKTVEQNYEVASHLQNMRSILGDTENCKDSFQGMNPSTGIPTQLMKNVAAVPQPVYVINTPQPGGIKVSTYALDKTFPGLASDETVLKVSFSRGSATMRDEITKGIKVTYTTDGSGNIDTCYAFYANDASYWVRSLADPNDIHYPAGDVGVGVANPVSKLDVNGPIKIADTAAACSATIEGTIKYNSTLKTMEYCNGTAWTSMVPVTSSTLAVNGYIRLGNGLTIQWGRATAGANGQTTINFPTAFTSVPYSITISGTSDSGSNSKDNWPTLYNHPANTTTTSFRLHSANDTNDPVSWIAIGI